MPLLNGLLNAIQGFWSIPDTFSVYWVHLKTTKNAFLDENFDIAHTLIGWYFGDAGGLI